MLPRESWHRELWLLVHILAGIAVAYYVVTQSPPQTLGLLGLLALWIFLGIPTCCGLKR